MIRVAAIESLLTVTNVVAVNPPVTQFIYLIVTGHEQPELLTALLDVEPKVPYEVVSTTPSWLHDSARLIRFTDDGQCVTLYCENFEALQRSPTRTPQEEADYARSLYLKHTTTATAVTSL